MGSPKWTTRDREGDLSYQQMQGHEKWQGQVEGEGRPHMAYGAQEPAAQLSPPMKGSEAITKFSPGFLPWTFTYFLQVHVLLLPDTEGHVQIMHTVCPVSRSLLSTSSSHCTTTYTGLALQSLGTVWALLTRGGQVP